MKVRFDYVSNSSSSSFVLVGKVFTVDEMMKRFRADNDLLTRFNKTYESDFETLKEAIEEYDIICLVEELIYHDDDILIETAEYDDVEEIALGLNPIEHMKGDETLNMFKERAAKWLNTYGLKCKAKEMVFVTGGCNASGESFFYDRG